MLTTEFTEVLNPMRVVLRAVYIDTLQNATCLTTKEDILRTGKLIRKIVPFPKINKFSEALDFT